jgi:hypothetical protein
LKLSFMIKTATGFQPGSVEDVVGTAVLEAFRAVPVEISSLTPPSRGQETRVRNGELCLLIAQCAEIYVRTQSKNLYRFHRGSTGDLEVLNLENRTSQKVDPSELRAALRVGAPIAMPKTGINSTPITEIVLAATRQTTTRDEFRGRYADLHQGKNVP